LESNDEDFDKENGDSLINIEKTLESFVQRMIKCEPEDFELVGFILLVQLVILNVCVILNILCNFELPVGIIK